jgi:lipoate---protein ligase
MHNLRFITTNYSYADYSTTISPAIERALEERIAPSTVVLNTFSTDSITSGYLDDPEKSINLDFCREHGVVVRRRQNAGGAVFGAKGGAFLCIYVDTEQPWVPIKTIEEAFQVSLGGMAGVLQSMFGFNAQYRPLNDIEVEGRKVVPSSARLEKGILSLRILINVVPTDRALLQKAIITVAEKTQDKKIKDVGKRFTCLEAEAGRKIEPADLEELSQKTVAQIFGDQVALAPGELTGQENQYLDEYQEKFNSDQWFFENSESLRFQQIPPDAVKSEGRHKAPAGLLRVTLLTTADKIHDLIITGDFHPSPYGVLKDMEEALRGKDSSLDTVRTEIEAIYARPDVEMAGIEVKDFTAAFDKALQASEGR